MVQEHERKSRMEQGMGGVPLSKVPVPQKLGVGGGSFFFHIVVLCILYMKFLPPCPNMWLLYDKFSCV